MYHIKNDKRAQTSTELICAGLLACMREKPFARITITDVQRASTVSRSTFYRNFMKVTSLSPVQYQKQIRLNEAQRLMLAKDFDAQKAAYAVGYESATQFSAEYKRRFGRPPARDVRLLKTSG